MTKIFCFFGFEIRLRRATSIERQLEKIVRTMDDESLRMAFALADKDPRWRAWRQLLVTAIDGAADTATSSGLASSHGDLAYYAGGVAHLRQFLDFVSELRQRALADAPEDAAES